jgi:hypothetical protein
MGMDGVPFMYNMMGLSRTCSAIKRTASSAWSGTVLRLAAKSECEPLSSLSSSLLLLDEEDDERKRRLVVGVVAASAPRLDGDDEHAGPTPLPNKAQPLADRNDAVEDDKNLSFWLVDPLAISNALDVVAVVIIIIIIMVVSLFACWIYRARVVHRLLLLTFYL